MGKSSFVHKAIQNLIRKAPKKSRRCYVPISINVGNDLLTSKELLYIICKLLSAEFEKKTRLCENLWSRTNILAFQLIFFCSFIITLLYAISDWTSWKLWIGMSLILIASVLLNHIYYGIWKLTNWSWLITVWQIKKLFKHLEERIDSETTLTKGNGFNANAKYKVNLDEGEVTAGLGYGKYFGKKNIYPIAHTSEIQDLLVNQLYLIKKLPCANFRFIFKG